MVFLRDPSPDPAPPLRKEAVLPVSLLVSSARLLLERHLGLSWVSGEISNFTRAASGHCYFNLKDAKAQARCVFFRHKAQYADFALKDGLAVEVRATASIYEARGEFQLNVESIRQAGAGELFERFLRLKARLEAAGWFSDERKRPLPEYPRAVGVVTSPRAAALRDILTTLKRRWPGLRVILYPCAVQGASAAAEIAAAIRTANLRHEVDVLIVGRGGGSIEDLWAFNEEEVARAVFESALPVISAVGHETDFTICDFVADARAATPTAAAAAASPDRVAMLHRLATLRARWRRAARVAMEPRMQRVDHLAHRLVHPGAKLLQQRDAAAALAARLARVLRQRLATATLGLRGCELRLSLQLRAPLPGAARLAHMREMWSHAGRLAVERTGQRLAAPERALAHLNPRAVLERGYSIVTAADGSIVRDTTSVAVGDPVGLTFARGGATATITGRRGPSDE